MIPFPSIPHEQVLLEAAPAREAFEPQWLGCSRGCTDRAACDKRLPIRVRGGGETPFLQVNLDAGIYLREVPVLHFSPAPFLKLLRLLLGRCFVTVTSTETHLSAFAKEFQTS